MVIGPFGNCQTFGGCRRVNGLNRCVWVNAGLRCGTGRVQATCARGLRPQ
jgi:hypothetical protein